MESELKFQVIDNCVKGSGFGPWSVPMLDAIKQLVDVYIERVNVAHLEQKIAAEKEKQAGLHLLEGGINPLGGGNGDEAEPEEGETLLGGYDKYDPRRYEI